MFQAAHQLPNYIYARMHERELAFERKSMSGSAQWNEAQLVSHLQRPGCMPLVEKAREFLTVLGYKLVLQELTAAVGSYEVSVINYTDAIELLKTTIVHRSNRAASAASFCCLLETQQQRLGTRLFRLDCFSGSEDAVDIVMVSDNGSFACTNPFFAQYGAPGRHIFAVHLAQYCGINVLAHFHPTYVRKISNPVPPNHAITLASLSWPEKLAATAFTVKARTGYVRPELSRSTSWSWAMNAVASRWNEVGLGGAEMEAARLPPLHAIRDAPEARKSRKAKMVRRLTDEVPVEQLEQMMKALPRTRGSGEFQDQSGRTVQQQGLPAKKKQKRLKGAHEKGSRVRKGKGGRKA